MKGLPCTNTKHKSKGKALGQSISLNLVHTHTPPPPCREQTLLFHSHFHLFCVFLIAFKKNEDSWILYSFFVLDFSFSVKILERKWTYNKGEGLLFESLLTNEKLWGVIASAIHLSQIPCQVQVEMVFIFFKATLISHILTHSI